MDNSLIKKNYFGLDIFKFIASLLVVAIHIRPFNSPILLFTKVAVPYFAMVSSYLFFKGNPTTEKLYYYVIRIIKLLLFWSIVFFPFIFKINNYASIQNVKSQFLTIVGDLFLRNFLTGSWFFVWLIYTVIIIFFLKKIINYNKIFFFSCVIYLYFLFSYIAFIPQPFTIFYKFWITYIGYYWMGFPFIFIFISLGAILTKTKFTQSIKYYLICLIISVIVLTFVAKVFINFIDVPLVVVEYFLFSFLINCEIEYHSIYKKLRGASVIIFCTHFVIAYGIITKQRISNNFLLYVVTVSIGLVLSLVIFKLEEHKYFKWLKYTY